MDNLNQPAKQILDGLSVSAVVATLLQWLPPLAAVLTIIWTSLRIYEWIENRIKKGRDETNSD